MPENDVQTEQPVIAPPEKIDRRLKKFRGRIVVNELPPPQPKAGQVPPNVPKDFVTYINRERKSDKKIT